MIDGRPDATERRIPSLILADAAMHLMDRMERGTVDPKDVAHALAILREMVTRLRNSRGEYARS